MNREAGFSDIRGADPGGMRALAARMATRGTARLRLSRSALRRLESALARIRGLCGAGVEDDEAALRLCRDGRLAENCAHQALSGGGQRLPACGGRPRIEAVMCALCAGGESRLDRDSLLAALRDFDAVRPLTMAELWAVPEAARIALAKALADAATAVAHAARQRVRAAEWARRPGLRIPEADPAFMEHALKLAAQAPRPGAYRRLEALLARRNTTPERVIRQAHAARALDLLRLDNLLANARLIDGLDWQSCFREVSRVDRELRSDPAGVYARMDDDSRAAVRDQVASVARRLGMTELALARHAVDAARACAGREGTVCWWLYDDAGRLALLRRMGRGEVRLPKLVPDPGGARTCAALIGLSLAVLALLAACVGTPWLWAVCVPPAWTAGCAVAGRAFSRRLPPARLLKMELDCVPEDCRTLVVMPVLLSGPDRVDEICARLEALGCLEKDENIEYLLLGDFADAPQVNLPSDAALLDRARTRVAEMNAGAGREKYAYLHRRRTLLETDGIWMGRDRKRGALTALNRLLLGEPGSENAFLAEGAACARLKGRFSFVLTLDADTRLLPGTVRRLIGAMAHPLNRPEGDAGCAVLQPRMEMLPSACANGFVKLFAGAGGVDTYPVSVSNLWQDATGTGIYAGKGIYDVAAFHRRLEGALPEGRVLSHDLVEGAIAGAGFLGDVTLYDGCPTGLSGWMRRQHRWTRGDWQLLPILFSRGTLPGGRRLRFADRLRMSDNLLRSLRAPALLALLLAAVWTGNGGALLAALGINYLEALLGIFGPDRLKWRRATAQLVILPVSAGWAMDAVLRTLWRLFISGRHLMDWVTAADAERGDGRGDRGLRVPARAAALLALPGLLVQGWSSAALALAALFWIGPGWIRDMEDTPAVSAQTLGEADRDALLALARDTWRFFEAQVPPDDGRLPPDNVQLDPPTGAARRTSPTNIGLYMVSCLAAFRLGFVGTDEMLRRLAGAVDAVERMEKWRGLLFNWYDIDDLTALKPRYVSSVDSGNLAASLLLCAASGELAADAALVRRMRALAAGMDFTALYDAERKLFAIGMDVDGGRLSRSHYDLLASEARILSFTAMMLGQVPEAHWGRLGRACTAAGGGAALLSWGGTMFEYLMPELFMPAPAGTLIGESVRCAIRAQRHRGERMGRPWGVSESGYFAFDAAMNYQYRAFGLRALALCGDAEQDVAAPYASMLAAAVAPADAARNLRRMRDLGWAGECGLYEAADYRHPDGAGRPSVVMSHMAHHQGMILCALCNALTDQSLCADFMGMPRARALALMLEEKPCAAPRMRRAPARPQRSGVRASQTRLSRAARPDRQLAETHLLYGGGATALVTADGAVHYARFGVSATRFSGDLLNRADAACVHLRDGNAGADIVLGGQAVFEPGLARFSARLGGLEAGMRVCVSPENGALVREIQLRNAGDRPVRCDVTDVVPVALATDAEWRAHAAFCSLFVESKRLSEGALTFQRRPRAPQERWPVLLHCAFAPGEITCETDMEKLTGRLGCTARPDGIADELTGTLGATLNPVGALRARLVLKPGERARLHFVLALVDPDASAAAWLEGLRRMAETDRAARLSTAGARAMLGFIGLRADQYHALQRLAALVFDGRLAASAKALHGPEEGVDRAALWSLGVSGDRPILLLRVTSTAQADAARAAVQAREFFRAAGVALDLVCLDDGIDGYARPVRDMLTALLPSGRLREGGAIVIDGALLSPSQRRALRRAAALCFEGGLDFYAQARAMLAGLSASGGRAPARLETGASMMKPLPREAYNGYGGFLPDGGYAIDIQPEAVPPAPWSNILAGEDFGMLLTDRGGGFCWHGNSRTGRLTASGTDGLREDWGWMLYLAGPAKREWLRLLPGDAPQMHFRAHYDAATARYRFETRRLSGEVAFCLRRDRPEAVVDVSLENRAMQGEEFWLVGFVDWLMGAELRDGVFLNCWNEDGACLATGVCPGVGYFASADACAEPGADRAAFLGRGGAMQPDPEGAPAGNGGWVLEVPLRMKRGQDFRTRFVIGWAPDVPSALARARTVRAEAAPAAEPAREDWHARQDRLVIETPDESLNRFANGFLMHQVRACRVLARTGPYQPGGAYGFRDQLQDMLALLHYEPERVRAHLLRCAGRQFESGDVMHWWHEPFLGVRTRISDDMLFLPFAAAAYVQATGDESVLEAEIPFLRDVEIPEGREDVYCEMRPGDAAGSLHEHCMRAFRRAARFGAHGLAKIGAGDWNDGMNRVGVRGRGESVWLSEFLATCAERYAAVIRAQEDALWLRDLARRMRRAVETSGWDGEWYLRAYTDDGVALGSARNPECRIDAVSQAWAVLAGLDPARCRAAMDAAWRMLADEPRGIIRLLAPPFTGRGVDPGYIRAYPAGVRENGAQYTHGALWLLLALIELGDADRAHRALKMLLPFNHADTPEKARLYRVEPYVMAADVYAGDHAGRGGWSWYTGSAAWMHTCILALLGYERRGDRVRLNALLGEWPEIAVSVRFGGSRYRLVCDRETAAVALDGEETGGEFIRMVDDGKAHTARFPARK